MRFCLLLLLGFLAATSGRHHRLSSFCWNGVSAQSEAFTFYPFSARLRCFSGTVTRGLYWTGREISERNNDPPTIAPLFFSDFEVVHGRQRSFTLTQVDSARNRDKWSARMPEGIDKELDGSALIPESPASANATVILCSFLFKFSYVRSNL